MDEINDIIATIREFHEIDAKPNTSILQFYDARKIEDHTSKLGYTSQMSKDIHDCSEMWPLPSAMSQAQVAQLPQGPAERDRYGGSPSHACVKEKDHAMVLQNGRQLHLASIIWSLAAWDK